jgi:hypothetical protein
MPSPRSGNGSLRAGGAATLLPIPGTLVCRRDVVGRRMRALAEALSVHFPQFIHEPYFEDCLSHSVEERHAEDAMAVTQMVLQQRPELLDQTIRDAKMMAEALDGVWNDLDCVVKQSVRRMNGTEHRGLRLIVARMVAAIRTSPTVQHG